MVLRSKHVCGFNTFFRPHQREFALERGVVHPSLTLWLDPISRNGRVDGNSKLIFAICLFRFQ